MEKALLEKLKNGTVDEIDVDMITARVMYVLRQMFALMKDFEGKFQNLVNEYPDELKMGGLGVVVGVTEVTDFGSDIGFKIIYGSNEQVKKIQHNLNEEIEK